MSTDTVPAAVEALDFLDSASTSLSATGSNADALSEHPGSGMRQVEPAIEDGRENTWKSRPIFELDHGDSKCVSAISHARCRLLAISSSFVDSETRAKT